MTNRFARVALAAGLLFVVPMSGGDVLFTYTVIDGETFQNGHKPKVIGDFANSGFGSVGTEGSLGEGFRLYQYPDWTPFQITTYGNGSGDEDAQVADVNGDGAQDIVIGGLAYNTYWLENPLKQEKNPYKSVWQVHQIDSTHVSHDVVVGDVNGDGKVDVATESGIYLQGATPDTWTLIAYPQIDRAPAVVQGTALANLFNDGFLDLIAPYRDGTALAWFENPKHHGGDPLNDVWTAHVIDPDTGVVGGLTVAAGDFNLDGRTDIAMAPMYADGTLVWYETPADRYKGDWIKHPIGPASYIHQGALQIRDIDGDGLTDIGFAEQEQSSTKRVGIFFNVGKGASWRLQVLASTGGQNLKTGIIGNDRHPSLLNANHGYFGAPNPLELFKNLAGSVSTPPSQPSSDDFDGTTLGGMWTSSDPLGDCTFQVNAGHLNITVPAGTAHQPWLGGNLAPRILQPATNTDLTATAKFDSAFTAPYQMNGIFVEQDAANYLRLEAYYDGVSIHIFAAGLRGNYPTVLGDIVAAPPSGSVWLRVIRVGDNWSVDWSNDGVTFSRGVSFAYPILVTRTGVYAGNATAGGQAPAFTAKIDYFHVGSTSPATPRAVSDDFVGSSLQSAWTAENPTHDGTFQVNSNHLHISVPAITAHDLWIGGNQSARVMQRTADVDLTTVVKFDSVFTAQYQMNGILIEEDAANYLRLEMYYDGASSHLFAAVLNNNSPRIFGDLVVDAARAGPSWLRVTRQRDAWALDWSSDGLTFQTGVQFNQPMKVSRIGVYAGNDSYDGPVPPFTAAINYFHVLP